MNISVIPLALTVMLGPQILVGMILITRQDRIKSSIAYITSVTLTLIGTTYIYYKVIELTNFHKVNISGKPILKYILVFILILIIIRSFVNRKKITKPPKWMTSVSKASLKSIFLTGVVLIALMPTDIAMEFTVGGMLIRNHAAFIGAFPFFCSVMLIASMPLFIYFTLGNKGPTYMEKANKWLNTHGYLINIVVLSFFIYLILS